MKHLYSAACIGCGNMGGAIASAILRTLPAETVAVCDYVKEKTDAFTASGAHAADVDTIAEKAHFIFLGVKPAFVPATLQSLKKGLANNPDAVIVSMAAAVTVASIKNVLQAQGTDRHVIRIMPNTPVAVGQGMTVFTTDTDTTQEEIDALRHILQASGVVMPMDESKIDAAGTVAGCGPAFAYMFAEALADGGVACGLSRTDAAALSAQMLLGASHMLKTFGHPSDLKDAVCSPGGTTIEGVRALEEGAFRAAVMNAVITAYEKTLQLKPKQ